MVQQLTRNSTVQLHTTVLEKLKQKKDASVERMNSKLSKINTKRMCEYIVLKANKAASISNLFLYQTKKKNNITCKQMTTMRLLPLLVVQHRVKIQ